MQTILTVREQDINPSAPRVSSDGYLLRSAARAVVFEENGNIHLLKINRDHYHKLPGGGIDEGEEIKEALARELMEEIGCKAEIKREVGKIVEYRDEMRWIQTSYCFIAIKIGNQVDATLEDNELEQGAEGVIVDDIDSAIKLLESDEPTDYEGKFIQIRDIAFLRKARELGDG